MKVETKENILNDFTSGDSHRIWSATSAVVKTRDVEILAFLSDRIDTIIKATNGVELGGMLTPNRARLEFAMQKLNYFRVQAGCLCMLYPKHLMYNPEQEQNAGNVRILRKKGVIPASEFICECTICKRQYKVQEGDYHWLFWEWKGINLPDDM